MGTEKGMNNYLSIYNSNLETKILTFCSFFDSDVTYRGVQNCGGMKVDPPTSQKEMAFYRYHLGFTLPCRNGC